MYARVAQLAEQLICNQQVVGSNPTAGSNFIWGIGEMGSRGLCKAKLRVRLSYSPPYFSSDNE
jgi:hypothetical protein